MDNNPIQYRYNTTILVVTMVIILIVILLIAYNVNIPITLDTDSADIVIVGGTSACILAYRLSQRFPLKSIIILERGRNRRNDPIVYNIANAATAGYTEPYSKVLPTDSPGVVASVANINGGGSSINYALAVRGSPDFYNRKWREQLKLSYDDLVNDYFPRIESYHPINETLSSVRFTSGKVDIAQLPVNVNIWSRILPLIGAMFTEGFQVVGQALEILNNNGPLRASDSFSNNVVEAISNSKRVPVVDDYNAEVVNCVAIFPQIFIHNRVGIRQSTDVAYLPRSVIAFDHNGNGRGGYQGNVQFVPNATVHTLVVMS